MAGSPVSSNLFVVVRTREKTLFMGDATSVSSRNNKGPFDVLAQHTNFISLISDFILIHPVEGEVQRINVQKDSLLKVRQNRVEVFLGMASNPS